MRVIYLILSVVMMFGIMRPAHAQDKEEWQKVFWAYQFIPDTLSPKDYLQQLDKIEQQATQLISDLEDEQERKVAQLKRYNGLLWGLGNYILKHDDESLRNVMAQKMNGLDMDSPDLDLLSGTEITNLVNGYLNFYHAGLSDVDKATCVLYNIKSEKVRNEYVLPTLMMVLKQSGYTDEIEGLVQDIDLCSKTEDTRKKAHKLKDWYYPVRSGELAPEIEAEDENGKSVKLSDYRGKIVFLDVWATWCGGCVEGLPYFVALREKYKERKDIVFLTLTIDEESFKESWKKFLKEKKFSGKIPHLFPTNRESFEKSYCITGIPRYILIDKEGKIVNAWHVSAKHEYFSFMFDTELLTLE